MGDFRRLDTKTVIPRDRFEYWRAMVSPLRLAPVGDLRPTDFRVSADVLRHGRVQLIGLHRDPATASWGREPDQQRLRLMLLAPSPGATAHWHQQQLTLDRGCVALLGSTDGGWRAPSGLHGIEVDVPRTTIPVTDRQLATANAPGRLRHDPVLTGLVGPALLAAGTHLDQLATATSAEFQELWTALVTMLLRSVTGSPVDGSDLTAARRLQIDRYIEAHLADPDLTPDKIATALRVSRRTVYTLMSGSQQGGVGVAAVIRTRRLQRAHDLLADPGCTDPIRSIAVRVGLPDPAHFSRLFTATYGYPPRDLQAART